MGGIGPRWRRGEKRKKEGEEETARKTARKKEEREREKEADGKRKSKKPALGHVIWAVRPAWGDARQMAWSRKSSLGQFAFSMALQQFSWSCHGRLGNRGHTRCLD